MRASHEMYCSLCTRSEMCARRRDVRAGRETRAPPARWTVRRRSVVCLRVHRDAPRYWLCSSLRGRARCRSLSYVHEQQAGDEADDEPPGDDSTALRPKTSWARDLLCVDVARLLWVLNWMSQGIGVSLNLGYPEFWGKGTELKWRYVWRCSTIMHM